MPRHSCQANHLPLAWARACTGLPLRHPRIQCPGVSIRPQQPIHPSKVRDVPKPGLSLARRCILTYSLGQAALAARQLSRIFPDWQP
jgi:hypothetical protein